MFGISKLYVYLGIGLATILAIVATYFAGHAVGYQKGKDESKVAISKYEKELSDAQLALQTASGKVTEKIVTVYRDKIVTIAGNKQGYDVALPSVQSTGNLVNGWLHLHDSAALNLPVDPAKAADKSISDTSDTAALGVVVDNYASCNTTREQLIALQLWITSEDSLINKKTSPSKFKIRLK